MRPRCSSARRRSSPTSAPADRRAEAASYFSVAVYAGLGIGPIIGEGVIERTSFEVAFLTAAAFAALAAALSLSLPTRSPPPRVADDDAAGDAGRRAGAHRSHQPTSAAFLHPAGARAGPRAGVRHRRVRGVLGVPARVLPPARACPAPAALFAVYSVVCLGVRLVGARLPERLGPRTSGTTTFCVLGAALLLLAAVPRGVGAVGGGGRSSASAMAFLYPSLMALTVNRAPLAERARAISSFTMFFEIGTAAGALALGAVADVLGKRVGFAGRGPAVRAGAVGDAGQGAPDPGPPRRPARPSPSTRRTSPPPSAATDPPIHDFHKQNRAFADFATQNRDRTPLSDFR